MISLSLSSAHFNLRATTSNTYKYVENSVKKLNKVQHCTEALRQRSFLYVFLEERETYTQLNHILTSL